jgi:hypothetical protein
MTRWTIIAVTAIDSTQVLQSITGDEVRAWLLAP